MSVSKIDFENSGILLEDGNGLFAQVGRVQFKSNAVQSIAEQVSMRQLEDLRVILSWKIGDVILEKIYALPKKVRKKVLSLLQQTMLRGEMGGSLEVNHGVGQH